LLEQGQVASHPHRAFGAEQAGKNSFSPHPFFFLPACFSERIFSDDGGASIWATGGILIFQILFDSLAILVLFFTLEVYLNKINF
jgi:hypothetical protein